MGILSIDREKVQEHSRAAVSPHFFKSVAGKEAFLRSYVPRTATQLQNGGSKSVYYILKLEYGLRFVMMTAHIILSSTFILSMIFLVVAII